jgi:GTPase
MRRAIRSDHPDDHRRQDRLPQGLTSSTRDGAERPAERAVLAAVILPWSRVDMNDPLAELGALAKAAGTDVVDSMVQKRTEMSPKSAFGKGRLEELGQRVSDAEASVVIFDNDLTPRQIRGIETVAQCKVIDRSELILDIFASRAKTHEAQLQVELAQLEYTAPRIRGMWTHLERIAGAGGATGAGAVGGVGTRGPGERQIELDRRIVRTRISQLKQRIAEIDRRKQREVKSRGDRFTASLVGYTNSGKSTLLQKLTGTEVFTADMLFATLDTKTVRWDLGEGRSVLLSDTVGFVRDLPHHLVASFRATLEETIHADLLVHVVDASSPQARQQMDAVDEVLDNLGCEDTPRLILLNKMDIAEEDSLSELLGQHRKDALQISALTGEGLSEVVTAVADRATGDAIDAVIHLPHSAGKLQTELSRRADVREREFTDDGVRMSIRMNRAQFEQLKGRHPELTILSQTNDDDDLGEELDNA